MLNIMKRQNGGDPIPALGRVWDPMRWMRDYFGRDPFEQMLPESFAAMTAFEPSFEVKEGKDGYVFTADVPGVKEEDIEINLTGSRLTIGGKREAIKEEKGDNFFTRERSYGSFLRAFTLPEGTDAEHVTADLKEGVLTVVVPKAPGTQPRRIALGKGKRA